MPPDWTHVLNLVSHSIRVTYTIKTEHVHNLLLVDVRLNKLCVNNVNTFIVVALHVNHVSAQLGCLIMRILCMRVPQGLHGQLCGAPHPGT